MDSNSSFNVEIDIDAEKLIANGKKLGHIRLSEIE